MPMFSQGIVTPAEGETRITEQSARVPESGQWEIPVLSPHGEGRKKGFKF